MARKSFSASNCTKYFNTCIKKGQSPFYAVQTIANNYNKTTSFVWNCLCRSNAAFCVKFNGNKCYFPTSSFKYSKSGSNTPEFFFWQYAVEYALCRKWITPTQVQNWTPTQTFWYVCNCFNNQYTKPSGFNPNYTFGRNSGNGYNYSFAGNVTSSRKIKSRNGYSYGSTYGSKRRAA